MRRWAYFFIAWAVLAAARPVSREGGASSKERPPPAVDRKPRSGLPEIIAGLGALSMINWIARTKLPLSNRRSTSPEAKAGRLGNGQARPIHDPSLETHSDINNDFKTLIALREEAQRCMDLLIQAGTPFENARNQCAGLKLKQLEERLATSKGAQHSVHEALSANSGNDPSSRFYAQLLMDGAAADYIRQLKSSNVRPLGRPAGLLLKRPGLVKVL